MSSSTKPYTNATFTKRVDHDGGAKREPRAFAGFAVCKICGAYYENKRWYPKPEKPIKRSNVEPETVECPACKQIREGIFEGSLDIHGAFYLQHREEIDHLLKNEANDAYRDNPLSRIMRWEEKTAVCILKRQPMSWHAGSVRSSKRPITANSKMYFPTRTRSFAFTGAVTKGQFPPRGR